VAHLSTGSHLGQQSKSYLTDVVPVGQGVVGHVMSLHVGRGSHVGQHAPLLMTLFVLGGHSANVVQATLVHTTVLSQVSQHPLLTFVVPSGHVVGAGGHVTVAQLSLGKH